MANNSSSKKVWPLLMALLFLVAMLVSKEFEGAAGCNEGGGGTSSYLNAQLAVVDQQEISPNNNNNNNNNKKLKIGIISGFVTNPDPNAPKTSQKAPRIKPTMMEHMLNKVCYAKLHGYDFIFNSTAGFPDRQPSQYWLNYGTWHRVPHMIAALPKYDWIIYMDTDYVIQDMVTPIEAFIKDWELHQLQNVSVFVPNAANGYFVFSAFAVMIRNSPFGHRMLENWMEFSKGLCPKGNFATIPGKYKWVDSDQPGIWYSLAKTHSEFMNRSFPSDLCNETTGFLKSKNGMGPELNAYFRGRVVTKGNQGRDLDKIPKDQPILWSLAQEEDHGGLGIQLNWGTGGKGVEDWPHAFGLHVKKEFKAHMKQDLQNCVKAFGCFVNYTEDGNFRYGCNGGQASAEQISQSRSP